jgi:hypothetical protein
MCCNTKQVLTNEGRNHIVIAILFFKFAVFAFVCTHVLCILGPLCLHTCIMYSGAHLFARMYYVFWGPFVCTHVLCILGPICLHTCIMYSGAHLFAHMYYVFWGPFVCTHVLCILGPLACPPLVHPSPP